MSVEELEARFGRLNDRTLRYQYIIQMGKKLAPLAADERSEVNRVRGCMSRVWMVADLEEGDPPRLRFRGDSDSIIVKGLFAILSAVYSGRTPREILDADLEGLFERLRLEEHLSPNRRNGFQAMIEGIRSAARRHLSAGA